MRKFTQADVNIASWNEFFREGGELNYPVFDTSRIKELKNVYKKIANFQNRLINKSEGN